MKDYQESAIRELLKKSRDFLVNDKKKIIVFKSPTGSGKTIMMAEFLKRLCNLSEFEEQLSFIWMAPRMLHKQSKSKLSNYYNETRELNCSNFEALQDRRIGFNEVLFFNWESINKKDNIYIRENERDNNLSCVLERTKAKRKVILIIDESHHGFDAPATTRVVQDISPNLTFRVSATPVRTDCPSVEVDIEDVKKEGMIKQGIVLNEGFNNKKDGENIFSDVNLTSKEVVLREAIKRREDLKNLYQAKGLNINPLLLIQLQDKRQGRDDGLHDIKEHLKCKYGITTDNGRLGVWLSDEKENQDGIEEKNNSVEVLIFKQAIALGWDCPRSHILVLFREWSSSTFTIQTLGRVMRTADIENGIYEKDCDMLNYAYVFTNLPEIKLDDDLVKAYTTIYKSERKSIYGPLKLSSWYRVRQREQTRLSQIFRDKFKKEAEGYGLKNKIDVNRRRVQTKEIQEQNLKRPRDVQDIEGENVNIENGKELENSFEKFISDALSEEPSFYPEERSVGNLKLAIYDFFESDLKINYGSDYELFAKIVLNLENNALLKDVIKRAKESYEQEVKKREQELAKNIWEIPESIRYNQNYKEKDVNKSIMHPFYKKVDFVLENNFINYLDDHAKVDWWFKNGEKEAMFFAIPYTIDNKNRLFYIDFLVKFKDGRLGFFDTKGMAGHGGAGESQPKVKALKEYIESSQRRFFGGIVTQKNNTWQTYDEKGQEYDIKNDRNWVPLVF